MKKVLLILLAMISIISGIYAVYAIFKGSIELVVGSALAAASFLILLWCLYLEKKSPLKDKNILFVFIPVIIIMSVNLAYAGIEPFNSGKEQLLSKLQSVGEPTELNAQTEKSKNEPIKQGILSSDVAKVKSIYGGGYFLNGLSAAGIIVEIIPTQSALPNKVYKVDLCEKGNIRETKTISWNEPQINVSEGKKVAFTMSKTEENAYWGKDLTSFLTAKVHE